MATLPVGEFPGLIQKEIATTRDPHRVFRLLGVWTERDPDGALAWARTQPSTIPLPEFGYNIPAVSGVLSAIAQKDPDRAWNLAQEFAPDRTDVERWELIGAMARRDPDQARDFVRKHVDELKSMNNPNAGWYGLNPEKVMPVAMELPPGPVRLEVVREMTRYYEEREDQLEAAERWFQTLPRAEQEAVADSAKTGDPFSEVSAEYREQLGKVWRLPEASSPN